MNAMSKDLELNQRAEQFLNKQNSTDDKQTDNGK